MSIFIHSESKKALEMVRESMPHALLLSGPVGIGLTALRDFYVEKSTAQVITVLPEKDEKVDIEKGTITIQSIRRLYELTRTIEPKGRIICIDYAERMATPAQNAFLKLLEEPSEGTHFVLLTHQPGLLLPTILSRVQELTARPITTEQSNKLLDELKVTDATKRAQLLFIAEGLPAELTRLSTNNEYFAVRSALVKDARSYITGSMYEKLLIAKKYKDSRTDAVVLVEDAMKLLRRTLAAKGEVSSLTVLTDLEKLHKRLTEQGNVRLQLSSAGMVY